MRWKSSHFPFIGASNLPSREEEGIALFALSQLLTLPLFPFSHLSGRDCEDVPKHFLCEVKACHGRNIRFTAR